jgi:hypothetical protein
MRKLSPELKREIEAFSYAVRSYFPEFLFPRPTGGLADFGSELASLRTADPELVRLEFAVPLLSPWRGGGEGRDPHTLREPDVRALLRERVTRESDKAMAAMLLDDPRALLERFLNMLERYWREAFEEEWARIEPELAAGVGEAGHQIEQRGLYGMLRGLWPEVRSDRQAERG